MKSEQEIKQYHDDLVIHSNATCNCDTPLQCAIERRISAAVAISLEWVLGDGTEEYEENAADLAQWANKVRRENTERN